METTKTTTITWASADDQIQPGLVSDRNAKLLEMQADGKTDKDYYVLVSPVCTTRYWRDQSAAEEFASFITGIAELYNCGINSIVFGDGVWPGA